jgi:hypothetical protein
MQYAIKVTHVNWVCNYLLLWCHESPHIHVTDITLCLQEVLLERPRVISLTGFSCLGHSARHMLWHWWACICCDTYPWGAWLLARVVWPSNEPDRGDCSEGHRIWADVPPSMHAQLLGALQGSVRNKERNFFQHYFPCRTKKTNKTGASDATVLRPKCSQCVSDWSSYATVLRYEGFFSLHPGPWPLRSRAWVRPCSHGRQMYRFDVCLLPKALPWRLGGSEEKLGHSTMSCPQERATYINCLFCMKWLLSFSISGLMTKLVLREKQIMLG